MFLGRRPTEYQMWGMSILVIGVTLVGVSSVLAGKEVHVAPNPMIGNLLVLLAQFSYSVQTVWMTQSWFPIFKCDVKNEIVDLSWLLICRLFRNITLQNTKYHRCWCLAGRASLLLVWLSPLSSLLTSFQVWLLQTLSCVHIFQFHCLFAISDIFHGIFGSLEFMLQVDRVVAGWKTLWMLSMWFVCCFLILSDAPSRCS